MGKVSIIIPVYNTEEFIEECLKSVSNQTYENLEVIIINDNSSERCSHLLERLCATDSRFKLFHLQERKGVGAARNFGIQKATGEFIYFLDSDDYIPENTIQFLVRHIGDHNFIRGRMRSTNLSTSIAIIFQGLFNIKFFEENRYNLIKNNSAVNFLFKKNYITKEDLSFSEDVEVFSDLAFMIPALKKTSQVPYVREAIYFKRHRNDPILNPSLSQFDDHTKIKDFLSIYNKLKRKYSDKSSQYFLDNHFLNFYRKDIVTYFENNKNISSVYDELSRSMRRIRSRVLKNYDFFLKREVKALKNGNLNKYRKVNSQHHFLRDFREGMKSKRKLYIFLYKRIFMKLPLKKDMVFFESFLGKSYSDNPKYIYQHMINNNMNYKYVWSVRERRDIPGTATQVTRFGLRYFYNLARSKYLISNARLPHFIDKRDDQVYLQTWHGTPLKKLVFDIEDIFSADPNHKMSFYLESRGWDYLSSPNNYSSKIFRRAFRFNKELLEYGYPRNDILYTKNTEKDIKTLKNQMGLPLDKKIILYAPTWRDDEYFSRGNYKFTLHLELDKLQQHLGEGYLVILRTHYHIANQIDVTPYKNFVFDFSSYDDIAELYLVSDILITDYSSVFFDYANLKRPILFYTYDLEKYRTKLRGFYFDIEREVPGPLLMTTEEVIDAIKNIDSVFNNYKDTYEEFYNKFCQWDNGDASKNTVERIFKN